MYNIQVYYYPKNVIALYLVDTADVLESELSTHCEAVLGAENDILGHKIQSFIEHSSATITGLKEKYDQLRIDNDELLHKVHTSRDTSGIAVRESRRETSSATGKYKETIGAYSGDSYVAFI
jgi:predicted amidohydrolase